QVGHQVAQKKSITTLPRSSARLTVLPVRSGNEKAGAALGGVYGWICMPAKSGGAAAQGVIVVATMTAAARSQTAGGDLRRPGYPMPPPRRYLRRSACTTRSGVIG